jgi:hypothetical protein
MRYRVHLPTRFMTVVEVKADSSAEALAKVKKMEGDHTDTRFVEFLFDELTVDDIDEIKEDKDGPGLGPH